jgi:hypothetical protein
MDFFFCRCGTEALQLSLRQLQTVGRGEQVIQTMCLGAVGTRGSLSVVSIGHSAHDVAWSPNGTKLAYCSIQLDKPEQREQCRMVA